MKAKLAERLGSTFWAIARFELSKRRRMLSTYVYAGVLFACGFLAMIAAGGAFSSVSVGMGADKVHANAPAALSGLITILCHLGTLITAAVFGQAVHQDRETRIDSLFFTTPLKKRDYLAGRFLGAVLFALGVFSFVGLGLWAGTIMPFVEKTAFGPNRLLAYVLPYLTTVLPNIIFSGAIFFALAVLTRRMMPVYVASVLLVIVYLMAGSLFAKIEYRTIAGLLDPFGMSAIRSVTEYRSVAEQNTLLIPLRGVFLANRALWTAVGLGLVGIAGWRFNLQHEGVVERRGIKAEGGAPPTERPNVTITLDGNTRLLARMTLLSFRETVKDVYFGVILFAGLLFVVIASIQGGALYGTTTYPVTWLVLELTGGTFSLFVLIILTFYSGELVWRERDAGMDLVADALPVPTWLPFLSKALTLFLVDALLLVVLLVAGLMIQTAKGYFHYELGLYLKTLFGLRLLDYALISILALTVHVLVNHKYIGHFVMVVYYVWTLFMSKLGLEHNLYRFGDSPTMRYSDMNHFGRFLRGVVWFDAYWAAFAVLLAFVCFFFWVRGVESSWRFRLREARRRASVRWVIAATAFVLVFAGLGGFIFYNTNILHRYLTSHDQERMRADYEKKYKPLAKLAQPRVTDVKVLVDVFPETPALRAHGVYTVKNETSEAIRTVYVGINDDDGFERLSLGDVSRPTHEDKDQQFYTFDLPVPLAPGQSLPLAFDLWFREIGFENSEGSTEVVENGTFFHSGALPVIGYQERAELTDDGSRKKYGLPPKERMRDLDDVAGRANNYISSDADWVTFDATVSTSPDQIALAPGYLEREWVEGGRRYFHYTMDQPVLHFFSVLSARYAVKRDRWNDVALEIYYHPTHTYDLDQMMAGMKDALAYCSTSFAPYQYRQARILEFPRYQSYAQSFPNTIPFSEAVGFIAKVKPSDPEDIDYPYYITAHEIAHQWWAHQVVGADVQGATIMSETLAQYSALMVMKHKFGPEKMKRFLRYELDNYLTSRSFERKKEVPLLRVENQPYIHYRKGSLVMYALQDYIGEDAVNRGLSSFVMATRFKGPPYPTARQLLEALRSETPRELQYLLHDMLETITLYDNRATSATYRALRDGKAEVTVTVTAKKLVADALGVEQEAPMDDLVDIGALDDTGAVIFREKRKLKAGESTQTFICDRVPAKAGIDPMNVLVDRKPDDNVVTAKKE